MPVPDPDLVTLAEQYRDLLPTGFEADVDAVESRLVQEIPIEEMRARGTGRNWKKSNQGIRAAILTELSLFLCSDSPRYKDLRDRGTGLTATSVATIAGYIAASLGIATGVATGCVSFLALAVARVAVGTFCRLNPPPAESATQDNAKPKPPVKTQSTGAKSDAKRAKRSED